MPELPYNPDFGKRGGLVPAVVQDSRTGDVLMLGWLNQDAWNRTLSSGRATFWSTSRHTLWEKGITSGDWLKVVEIRVDCDDDTVLYRVEPQGEGACHTKNLQGRTRKSCFFRRLANDGSLINLDP
jgi:phosphoribosyl-AMP cyclohydrolase